MASMFIKDFKRRIDALPFGASVYLIRPIYSFAKLPWRLLKHCVCTILAGIFCIFKFKFPDFYTSRIGHLMCEPDCFLKEHFLTYGEMPRGIILAPKGTVANSAALSYWATYFVVIKNPLIASILLPLQRHPWTKCETARYVVSMYRAADVYRINANWGKRPPLLKLTDSDRQRGEAALREMGVAKDSWYVCIHAREGKYSPEDEHFHSFRNLSITDFEKSVAYIHSKGGFCIRMGDSTMQPATDMPGIVDYALSPFKQEWMDLYLAATCKFFLGSNSGAYIMATVFGRPSALVGIAPLSAWAVGVDDICIPMLYANGTDGKALAFDSIFQSPLSNLRLTGEYEAADIVLIHNSEDEILDLTIEQFERVQGDYVVVDADEVRQAKLKAMLKEGHYCYGTASRMGNAFLKKYEDYLE